VKITPLAIPEVQLIELDVHRDERGHFLELFNEERFAKHGLPTEFRQDNHSLSRRDVLRGLHYQLRHPQGKLLSCVRGRIFDVAVDIRVGSPTFAKWVGRELSEDRPELVWIPQGFAHGFCAMSGTAEVQYKCTDVYVPEDEHGIVWNDADLNIAWPIEKPVLSRRDWALPKLRDAELPQYGHERNYEVAG
jgi:dTDP-4-dehydrorhamnose 3,5-epimerase